MWGRSSCDGRIESFVHHMSFVLAIRKFVARHLLRRWIAQRDRRTAHEFIETRTGENKREMDVLIARIFKTDPRVGRNENNSSRVNVTFLRAQPNVRAACLNQQNLVLAEMLMPWDNSTWRNFLCT